MPNYPGKRKGRRRIVIWAKLSGQSQSRPHEWIITGSKKEADQFEAKKRIELGQQTSPEFRTAPSFTDFCLLHYRPHAEGHLKASTWHKVRKYQVETLNEHFGPLKLSELRLLDVERYKAERAKLVEASSVNNELRVLRTILNYARAVGVPVPELRWKKLPIRGQGRVFCWTDQDVAKLFVATKKAAPELVPVLAFMLNTGCRKGEAIAAEWSWLDFDRLMLRIPSNRFWQPKNGLPREVPLLRELAAMLKARPRTAAVLFPNSLGEPFAQFPKDAFWAARAEAGIRGVPHTTRHTYASHFLAKVPDLFLLAQVLGHSHQRVSELYSHLLPDHLKRARNAVRLMPDLTPKRRNHG